MCSDKPKASSQDSAVRLSSTEHLRLWLRDRACALLLQWFDSPGLHVKVLGQDTEPKIAPDVLVGILHGSHCNQFMIVRITVSRFGQMRLLNALHMSNFLFLHTRLMRS